MVPAGTSIAVPDVGTGLMSWTARESNWNAEKMWMAKWKSIHLAMKYYGQYDNILAFPD